MIENNKHLSLLLYTFWLNKIKHVASEVRPFD